jgi:hypothetical protein
MNYQLRVSRVLALVERIVANVCHSELTMDVSLTSRKAKVSLGVGNLVDSESLSECIVSLCYLVKLAHTGMFVEFAPIKSRTDMNVEYNFVPREDWGKELVKELLVDLVRECFDDQDVLVHVSDSPVRRNSTFIELEFAENGERERSFCKAVSHLFKKIGKSRGRRLRVQIKEKV